MTKFAAPIPLLAAAIALTGCNALLPFIFVGEHKKTVTPEFDKLRGKRAVVLVWADAATMFDYPYVRLELATYVSDRIRAGVKESEVIDAGEVEDFLNRHLDSTVDPAGVGKQFSADYVVYVELLNFQIRDPASPDLVQGRAKASISVFDLAAAPDETQRYTLAPAEATYPNQPVVMSAQAALRIRQQTYESFAETVARKFFEHQVDF